LAVKPFELFGGHPALDFVNTLDNRFGDQGPDELLPSYGELLRFLEQSKMLSAGQTRQLARAAADGGGMRAIEAARELREGLAEVLYGGIDARSTPARTVRLLEKRFHEASAHRTLTRDEAGFDWGWNLARKQTDFPVWLLAQAACDLLVSDALARVRSCGSPTCRWLFLDTSKNGKRRWCSMELCGNRMKAKRFHARREGLDSSR
jgi:predicted RNA-binding Zn ribbon-like protein